MDGADDTTAELHDRFVELRPLLFSIAYQMTGSVADSEDIVSDSYLRLRGAVDRGQQIRNVKQYLTTIVTRVSIDHLRSARTRRETYVGPWLPEPLVEDPTGDFERVELADTLSMAFLVLLESLSPTERAVFLLREVLELDYREVSAILGTSEANCRQLLRRARQHIDARKPRFDADRRDRDALAARFFAALESGDLAPLVDMLAADVVAYGDGGGRGPSLPRPVTGREKVLRLLRTVATVVAELDLRFEQASVNGQPGALLRTTDGRLLNVLALDIRDGLIATVRSVVNPDKLQHLGPLGDATGLARHAAQARRRVT